MFRRFHGIFAFAMGILVFTIMESGSSFFQSLYFDFIYKWFHAVHHAFRIYSPLDLTDLILVLAVIGIIRVFWKWIFGMDSMKVNLINPLCWIGVWFLIAWGLNYALPSFQERAEMQTSNAQPDILKVIQTCEILRNELSGDPVRTTELTESEIQAIDKLLNEFFSEEFPEYLLNAHVKTVSETGWLRRIGIAGIYFPFSFQGHVDMSYTRSQVIFTAAHELSHAHGITDEGEANLIAYLALQRSDDPEYSYAAEFTLLRYLMASRKQKQLELPEIIKRDLEILQSNRAAHRPFFGDFSNDMNNIYLKTMGVKSGIDSYQTFPKLVKSFENRILSHKRKSAK